MTTFLDTATITIESGAGGDGCVSLRKEKYVPRGGPDGGNGGAGGSVSFEATSSMTTLQDFRYKRNYKAANGEAGSGRRKSGPAGQDVVVYVPCGTEIHREEGQLLGDLTEPGQRLLIAAGGRGGKGNWEFRNARNQTPLHAQPGKPGVRVKVRLELKLIADIGLVGLPNAGKSTLLSVVTSARPKIAGYPFTTLVPNLGIVDLGGGESCTLADIPGLIEGASQGKGLGHEFLRHVERTRALLLLVDPVAASCEQTLTCLRQELGQYGERLSDLPFAIVVTKRDLLTQEVANETLARAQAWGQENGAVKILAISAAAHRGLAELKAIMLELYRLAEYPA